MDFSLAGKKGKIREIIRFLKPANGKRYPRVALNQLQRFAFGTVL
jgi:hypothetical protein